MDSLQLSLYVADAHPPGPRAIRALRSLLDADEVEGTLEVIDIRETPERAEEARILAVPALIREEPSPSVRVIGDLTDESLVRRVLGLPPLDRETRGASS